MTVFTAITGWNRHFRGLANEFRLACAGGVALMILVASLFDDGFAAAVAVVPFFIGIALAGYGLRHRYPHDELGLCNLITIVRLALISGLTPLVWSAPGDAELWLAFGVAVVSLLLDGVDGWAARRSGLTSTFGARFDMEVDAVFALLLSILAFSTGQAGPWVLALGVPHYVFIAAAFFWPWVAGDLPDLFSRKVICVLQLGVLLAFLVPIIPQGLMLVASGIVAVALGVSFLRDVVYLHARRAS